MEHLSGAAVEQRMKRKNSQQVQHRTVLNQTVMDDHQVEVYHWETRKKQ
jgi:hypothetical protein